MKIYTYPRVNISSTAKVHRRTTAETEDTTSVFIPFQSEFGPANRIQRITTLEEFVATFGALNYEKQGQTALNIANWLTNGGTVYAYRIVDDAETFSAADIQYAIADEDAVAGTDYEVKKFLKVTSTTTATTFGAYNIDEGKLVEAATIEDGTLFLPGLKSTTKYIVDNAGTINAKFYTRKSAIEAKYPGKAYNDLSVTVSKYNGDFVSLTVKLNETKVETHQKISFTKLESIGDSSSYISSITLDEKMIDVIKSGASFTFYLTGGKDETKSLDEAVREFYAGEGAADALGNRLQTPINFIIDAGYSLETKTAIKNFVQPSSSDAQRDDIIVILDLYENKYENNKYTGKKPEDLEANITSDTTFYNAEGNIALYSQACLISEGTYAGKDIWVTATYFLTKLIPYNDNLYGIQYPVAGLTRGKISGVNAIDVSPNPARKQDLFNKKINYIEKDSRGLYFMSQRTHDISGDSDESTALSFLNNARVKNKVVQDLEKIGREYLFEFNDATTLSNMSIALNKYVNTWVQNRTLSYANVIVEADEYSNETVNIGLSIQFTGTIEIINIDIVIE